MTVLVADVFDVDCRDTRTRILYVPFVAGAFHFREYVPFDRLADAPFFHAFAVESLYCSVAFTLCAGGTASAPATLIVVPALAVVGAAIESTVMWHSEVVAPERGVSTTANAMAATARLMATTVRLVSVFFMLPLRE